MDECGDDDVFNRLRADLQDVLSFKAGGASANGKFLERYIRQEASFHVHYRVGITPRHTDGGDLCALLEATDYGCGVKPSGGMEILTNGDSGQDCVKVSVFIDVRKLGDNCHDVVTTRPTMVWLQTLDECKRSFGDSRKLGAETIINGVLGGCNPQGKQSTFLPFGGQHDPLGLSLTSWKAK